MITSILKYKISAAFIVLCGITGHAQVVFKNIYSHGLGGKFYELPNNNLLIVEGGGIIRLTPSGNIYFQKDYSTLSFATADLLKSNPNKYILSGDVYDTCSAFPSTLFVQPGLAAIDSMGLIQWSKYYNVNGTCGASIFYSFLMNDNGVLLSGGKAGSPQIVGPNSFVMRTDSTGHLLWSKYFYNHHGGAQFAAELSDKSVVAGLNIDSGGAVLARLDSAGNLLWSKGYVRPRGFLHSILPESDGTFLVTGTTDSLRINLGDQYPPWFHPTLFLMKIDSSGQVLWAKEYDDSTGVNNYFSLDVSHLIKLDDGSYMIFCGKYTNSNPSVVLMMHIDVSGNILWNRSHGPNTLVNQCQYIIQTSDGGFLMSEGTIGNYPNGWQGAYELIKTDSMGHSTGCFEYTENINVYPYFPLDSDVVLLSIDGATEYTANVRDTSYGPTVMYDECVLLTSGNPYVIDKARETIAYPSPTTGKFAVRSQPPQQNKEERYLTVYDSMGRIVLQKQVTGKEDTPVDLSKQKKGIYLIRILEGDKVSESKVVVE